VWDRRATLVEVEASWSLEDVVSYAEIARAFDEAEAAEG